MTKHLEYFIWTPISIAHLDQPTYYCGIAVRVYETHRELSLMLDYYNMMILDRHSNTEISHSNVEQVVEQIKIVQDELFVTAKQHGALLGGHHRPHFNDLIIEYHQAVDLLCEQLSSLLNLLDNFQLDAIPRNWDNNLVNWYTVKSTQKKAQ